MEIMQFLIPLVLVIVVIIGVISLIGLVIIDERQVGIVHQAFTFLTDQFGLYNGAGAKVTVKNSSFDNSKRWWVASFGVFNFGTYAPCNVTYKGLTTNISNGTGANQLAECGV